MFDSETTSKALKLSEIHSFGRDLEFWPAVGYTVLSGMLLVPFAETAKHYPPHGNPAPDGVEGVSIIGTVLFTLVMFVGLLCIKQFEHPRFLPSDYPVKTIGVSLLYIAGCTIAVYEDSIASTYSWASLSIILSQAALLGVIFEIADRPDPPDLENKSNRVIQFHIDNWRQFIRVFLSLSIAVGIGFFLQIYSRNFLNGQHIFMVFAPLGLGIIIALELLRRRITRIGSFLH